MRCGEEVFKNMHREVKTNSQPFLLQKILWGETSSKQVLNYTLHLIKHRNAWRPTHTHMLPSHHLLNPPQQGSMPGYQVEETGHRDGVLPFAFRSILHLRTVGRCSNSLLYALAACARRKLVWMRPEGPRVLNLAHLKRWLEDRQSFRAPIKLCVSMERDTQRGKIFAQVWAQRENKLFDNV